MYVFLALLFPLLLQAPSPTVKPEKPVIKNGASAHGKQGAKSKSKTDLSPSERQDTGAPRTQEGQSKEDNQQDKSRDGAYQVKILSQPDATDAPLFWPYLIFTALGVLVNAAIWVLILRQTKLNRDQVKASIIAANAAKDSAVTSRWSMVASDRAYVHQNGFRYFSHFDKKTNQYFWRIHPLWINSGNTPTRKLEVYVGYELRDSPLPENFAFPITNKHIPTMIAPKGIIASTHYDIEGPDVVAVSEGRKHFYVWGVARYRDVFPETEERITKFCCFIRNISGNPLRAFDEKTNPVEMLFHLYDKHNCADGDCEDDKH